MSKVTLNNISSFQNDSSAVATYAANNATLTTAFDNTLSRDGTSPNQMGASLDMNNNRILNLPTPTNPLDPIRLQDLDGFSGGGGGDVTYTAPFSGAVTRTILDKLSDLVSVLDFGASPSASAAANTVAFQSAVDAVPNGGILVIPTVGYSISGTISITKPITIIGPSAFDNVLATITATTATNTVFSVNANGVTIRDICISRAGTPTTGNAIEAGLDPTIVSDGAMTASSATLTSATAHFTVNDVGKSIFVVGAASGFPLLTTIAAFVNSTTVTLSASATSTVSGATVRFGNMYKQLVLDNVEMYNHNVGLKLGSVGVYTVDKCKFLAKAPIQINNVISQGFGSSFVTASVMNCSDAAGFGVLYNSGSDVRFENNKFLGGTYCFKMDWNQSTEANLTISGNSLENFGTAAIFLTSIASYQRVNIINNTVSGTTGTLLNADNSAGTALQDLIVTGNNVREPGYAGSGIIIGKVNCAIVSNNIVDFSGTGTGVELQSNSTSCIAINNNLNVATPTTNAGTNNTVSNGATGTGAIVLATSPTLVTPTLGAATATSINKLTVTAPATSATLTVANGKTLTASNTLTLAGTDSTTLTFQGTDTYVGRTTTDTLTNKTIDTASTNTLKVNGNTISATAGTATLTLPNVTSTLLSTAGSAFSSTASNPTGTTSTSGVMMGLGSVFTITPKFSTRVMISLSGNLSVSGGAGTFAVLKYGTGTAPINGAAITGTTLSSTSTTSIGTGSVPFTMSGIATSLTPGTAYWFDISLQTQTAANTASMFSPAGLAIEV